LNEFIKKLDAHKEELEAFSIPSSIVTYGMLHCPQYRDFNNELTHGRHRKEISKANRDRPWVDAIGRK
jgi:hypothetical protein